MTDNLNRRQDMDTGLNIDECSIIPPCLRTRRRPLFISLPGLDRFVSSRFARQIELAAPRPGEPFFIYAFDFSEFHG